MLWCEDRYFRIIFLTTLICSNPGYPFCTGVTLAKLAAVTMDEQGNETFDASGALDKLRKVSLTSYHEANVFLLHMIVRSILYACVNAKYTNFLFIRASFINIMWQSFSHVSVCWKPLGELLQSQNGLCLASFNKLSFFNLFDYQTFFWLRKKPLALSHGCDLLGHTARAQPEIFTNEETSIEWFWDSILYRMAL